jgi:molecular chaperone DnaJ
MLTRVRDSLNVETMDFYAILGLGPQATTADIKRAYRRLARRYHPGINPGDRAAADHFRRITEAYDTLVDPERRREYDAGGEARPAAPSAGGASFEFAGFDFSIAAHGSQAATFSELFADVLHPEAAGAAGRTEIGADIHAEVTVSFVDAARGVERQVIVTRQDVCAACGGSGSLRTAEGRCTPCHGTGRMRWARGHMVFSKSCAVCGGTGRQRHQRCPVCSAHGRTVRTEGVVVSVQAGTTDGTRLRVAGKGHAGRHGGRTGDLYVTVHVERHHLFRREGDDLHLQVPIAVHEAVLGARIDVPTLDGTVKLRVPPGTQGGQRFRLRGHGIRTASGGHGDLVAEVRLVLPPVADERSKELMREFGRLNGGDVRQQLWNAIGR